MMAFRSHLLALLAAAFLCLGLCAASSVPTRGDIHSAISPPSLDEALETVQLWKRRSHSSPSRCASSKSKTIHNENGYGGYYAYEQGSKKSTIGGTTPDGSGTAPRFDNSTGAFVTLADDAAANNVANDKQKYLSYLGGAAVPFKSGNKSPNGVTAKKLDNLGFNTVDENNVKNGDCAVPSTAYGYQYESKYKLSTGNVAVYCLCEPSGLCGCDDHHSNSSFVPAMLSDIGMGTEAQNISKACTISLDGATTILVDGGLSNGSTKADPAAPAVRTRKNTCAGRALTGGTDGSDSTDDTGAATSLAVNSWLVGTVALGMASLIWL